MPVANFPEYSRQLSDAIMDIVGNGQARITDLQVDQRSIQRGYITGILIFEDESELHFREYIDTTRTMPRIMYAYHYQDAAKALIFRYDNALHRPALSQQEHKHTPTSIDVGSISTFIEVLDEILNRIGR